MNERMGIIEERQVTAAKYARFIRPRPWQAPKDHTITVDCAKPEERTIEAGAPVIAKHLAPVAPVEPAINPTPQDITIARVQQAFLVALREAGYRMFPGTKQRCYTREDLTCKARSRVYSWPRHVCILLVRRLVRASYPKIGKQFGKMDHTSVMHAMLKGPSRMIEWPALGEAHAKVLAIFEAKQ